MAEILLIGRKKQYNQSINQNEIQITIKLNHLTENKKKN